MGNVKTSTLIIIGLLLVAAYLWWTRYQKPATTKAGAKRKKRG